jgi:hypothetical protein
MSTSGLVLKLSLALTLGATTNPVRETGIGIEKPMPTEATLSKQDKVILERAMPYLPMVSKTILSYWETHPYPVLVATTIEQESLWKPKAELCVPKPSCTREYGFGFGQLTITPKFNAFVEVKNLNPLLKDWSYEDRFNPEKQVLGILTKAKANYKQCKPLMLDEANAFACVAASYNGGLGGFLSDRRVCGNTRGCTPTKWFGNIENTSMKAKVAHEGYGKSFFQINREYVLNVTKVRTTKYVDQPGYSAKPF